MSRSFKMIKKPWNCVHFFTFNWLLIIYYIISFSVLKISFVVHKSSFLVACWTSATELTVFKVVEAVPPLCRCGTLSSNQCAHHNSHKKRNFRSRIPRRRCPPGYFHTLPQYVGHGVDSSFPDFHVTCIPLHQLQLETRTLFGWK